MALYTDTEEGWNFMCNSKESAYDKTQSSEIREVPDINEYDEIIKAVKTGRLVIFIGAGVSKQIGLPLWNEFAFSRLETVYQQGLVDYRTYCDLKKLEPKKLLTICEMFLKENNITPQPAKEIFKITDYMKYKEVYGKLYSMNAIYVTTNYDECLDYFALNKVRDENVSAEGSIGVEDCRMVDEHSTLGEVILKQSELLESKLQNGNVIHIHGSVNDESGMIITLSDYMQHYGSLSKDSHPELSIFLDRIFNTKYVVLFMGYGLEEYEILEYMLSKVKNPKNTKKHYLLYNCFKEDWKLVNLLKKYYLDFGVELIPYDISKTGYSQLIKIIDEWSKVLNKFSKEQDYIQKMQFIDEVIADTSSRFDINVKAVIDMAQKDESLEKYLFRKISDVRWLDILLENDFFRPEKVPTPIDKGNGYSIPYWENTDYLNRLLSNAENLNKVVIDKVLEIIRAVSLYKDDEGNTIDNFHVWKQFTDIISKIPNEYITNEIVEITRVWTKSRFKIDFVVERIGEVLLCKFLNSDNPEDFKKVQIVIDIITGLELDNKSLIIGEYYFQRIFDEKTIGLIAQKCSIDFLEGYSNSVSEVLHIGTSRNIIKTGNDEYIIKLMDYNQKFTVSILQTTDNPLSYVFVNKSEDSCKVLYERDFQFCNVNEFIKYVLEWLYEIFDESRMETNLHLIVRNLYYGLYTQGAYHSLYASCQMYNNDTDELILHFYKDIILKKFQIEGVEERKIIFLNRLLNSKFFALIKVALYVIGNLQGKYLSIIWDNLDSEIMMLVFEESYFGDELRVILENIKQIDEEQASKILKLIEYGPYSRCSSSDSEKSNKAWKIKRLNALRHISYFSEYITKHFKSSNPYIKLGPTIGEVQTGWNTGMTPLKENDLIKMTSEELSRYISTFKPQGGLEGPTVDALGKGLREFIKNNPGKYDSNLAPFINSPYYYIYEIFNGFMDAWKEKKIVNWSNILDFMIRYVNRDEFWNDTFIIDDDGWNANHNWVVGVFADIICEGTRNDEWAMEYELVQRTKNIILFILDKVISLVEYDINDDYLHYVLNSIKGRSLKALLYICLYSKRNSPIKNKEDVEWDNELHDMFKRYLDSDVTDAYILFGEYLPKFIYLDKWWSSDKISNIMYESKNWEGFMVGYINSGTIFKDIYIMMKTHYKYSIHHVFRKEKVIEDVANHIALGYLYGFEDEIDNELFNEMIEKWDYKMVSKVLWYFWTFRNKVGYSNDEWNNKEDISKIDMVKVRIKIIGFWDMLYARYKYINAKELSDEDKKLISDSIKLIEVLDNIDENSAERIKFAIPYAEVNYNSHYFIERISDISSDADSAQKRLTIGGLLLDFVKHVVPTYPEDKIIKLVQYLYDIKDDKVKEYADQICNIYAKYNIEFLRDICLEHRDF